MTVTEHKARFRQRRAAALGMTLAEFDAHIAREQARIDEINRYATDRELCRGVLAAQAARKGNRWEVAS